MTLTRLVVFGHAAIVGTCDLCAEVRADITDTVSIRRNDRQVAVFSACESCGRAARRLAAGRDALGHCRACWGYGSGPGRPEPSHVGR